MNKGEFSAPGVPVLEMESQDSLEISCRLSALYYDYISDKTELLISYNGIEIAAVPVLYKAPNIDTLTRTFEIKAQMPISKNIISGSLYDVEIVLEKHNGFGINTNSIIAQKGGKQAVYVVDSNKAVETAVNTGLSDNEITEILNPEILKGKAVISSGHFYINDGDEVRVVNGGTK